MDSNSPVSPETLQSDLALELEQLKHELQIAEGKIMQLELALLQSRDFAIGAAAEAGAHVGQGRRAGAIVPDQLPVGMRATLEADADCVDHRSQRQVDSQRGDGAVAHGEVFNGCHTSRIEGHYGLTLPRTGDHLRSASRWSLQVFAQSSISASVWRMDSAAR